MGPKILGRSPIRDLNIDAQHFGTASLNAPRHEISGFRLGAPVGTAYAVHLGGRPLDRESSTVINEF
jgi:hypothetical protein